MKSPAQMLEGWSVSGILTLQDGLPWWPNDTTNDFLGTNEFGNSVAGAAAQPWNYSGPTSAFKSGPTAIPCFGGASGCTAYTTGTVTMPSGTVLNGVPQPPAACLNAAEAAYSGNTQLQDLAVAALMNTDCYVQNGGVLTPPAYGTVGNAPRNLFRSPNYYNVDFSVAKLWKFKERYSAQFRMEFFNLFNRARFRHSRQTRPE